MGQWLYGDGHIGDGGPDLRSYDVEDSLGNSFWTLNQTYSDAGSTGNEGNNMLRGLL